MTLLEPSGYACCVECMSTWQGTAGVNACILLLCFFFLKVRSQRVMVAIGQMEGEVRDFHESLMLL